ncbi:hypothetical protein Tco_1421173 [Tanacetum coccineum]
MSKRAWTEKDQIDNFLKERRLMRSLEKVVEHAEFDESDTHVLERLDTSAGNPVKEILLKLNLPDHKILKDGGEGFVPWVTFFSAFEEGFEALKATGALALQMSSMCFVKGGPSGLGYENYNAVPPPYTGNFMPPTPDLSFTSLDEFVNEPVVENCKAMSSEEEPKVVKKNYDAPIIEELVLDDEEKEVSQPKTEKKTVRPGIVKKEFVKSKQQEKTTMKTVKQVDCNYHQKQFQNQRMVKPVWNNAQRNISKPAVLVNTARQVNATHSKTTVNAARSMSYLSKTAHSTVKRPIHKNTTFKNSNINQRVNTVRGNNFNTARPKAVVNAVKGNNVNVVKASACWVWKPKTKVLDHVSKHDSASITIKKFDYVDAQGEFVLWRMRIEQYIQMIDYALWEVIENGATLPKTVVVEGVEKVQAYTLCGIWHKDEVCIIHFPFCRIILEALKQGGASVKLS